MGSGRGAERASREWGRFGGERGAGLPEQGVLGESETMRRTCMTKIVTSWCRIAWHREFLLPQRLFKAEPALTPRAIQERLLTSLKMSVSKAKRAEGVSPSWVIVNVKRQKMYDAHDLIDWQRDQYEHDMKYHFDVLSLHKNERLKHYALHFAKYTGRIARGDKEAKTLEQTLVDAVLVTLSTANTLHQELSYVSASNKERFFTALADASGRICDAAEKIDHQEPFIDIARVANQDIFNLLLREASSKGIDISVRILERRRQLKSRQFFVR